MAHSRVKPNSPLSVSAVLVAVLSVCSNRSQAQANQTLSQESASEPRPADRSAAIAGVFTLINAGVTFALWRSKEKLKAELSRQNELELVQAKTAMDMLVEDHKAKLKHAEDLFRGSIEGVLAEGAAQMAHEREYREKVEAVLALLLHRVSRARTTFEALVERLKSDCAMDDSEYVDFASRGLADASEFLGSATTHDRIVLPESIQSHVRRTRQSFTKLFLELSSRHISHEQNLPEITAAFDAVSSDVAQLEKDIRRFLKVPA
jgi:hypothetical protein